MRRFLLRRVGQVIGTIFGVVTLIFFLQHLTGDPTYLLVPETATQADIDAMRRRSASTVRSSCNTSPT